ncbi:MAG: hypothetical protein IKW00_08885 [Clostridia bacterium]|nr:hypothetical protein [Clostridia bacterium]
MQFIEIAGRTYELKFTAQSLLRGQQMSSEPFRSLFCSGEKGAKMLLYCALCPQHPSLTVKQAASLFDTAENTPLLYDKLCLAFHESGFPREGITLSQLNRLMDSAARAGMQDTQRLEHMTLAQINRELNAFLARAHFSSAAPASMTDDAMKSVLTAFARRTTHVNA